MSISRATLLWLCTLAVPPNSPDDKRERFLAEIRRVYDFKPTKLTKEEQEKKRKELETFWKMVEDDKETLLPLLREQLQSDKTSAFFHFDGARLLVTHSKEKADLQAAAHALGHAELEGLNTGSFFDVVHHLAVEGADVTEALNKILDKSGFAVYLVEHALTLGQDMCCLYCTLPMKEELYVDKLIARLKKEKNPFAAKSILICLQSTVTEKARKAMQELATSTEDKTLQETANHLAAYESRKSLPESRISAKRELFNAFVDDYVGRRYDNPAYDFETYEKEAPYLVVKDDYAKLKEMRRIHAARVSDEALDEIAYLTRLIQIAFTFEK